MSKARGASTPKRRARIKGEAGAVAIEYVMILGFITALVIFLFSLLYPQGGKDIESLINAWGDKIATQIAGDKISKETEDAWGNE